MPPTRRARWLTWALGLALLLTLIVAARQASEGEAFLRLVEQSRPLLLLVAFALQAGTYLAQGAVFRACSRAAGRRLPRGAALELSLGKLFADQAIPSAGLSGNVLVAAVLERLGLPAPAVKAAVLINVASYHIAYIIALASGIVLLAWTGALGAAVATVSAVFLAFATLLATGTSSRPPAGGFRSGWSAPRPGH